MNCPLQVRVMGRRVILISLLALIVTAEGFTQTCNQDPTSGDVQRQLEELRSQMAKMQNRIAELESAQGSTPTNFSADSVSLPSQTPSTQDPGSPAQETKSSEEPTSFHFK